MDGTLQSEIMTEANAELGRQLAQWRERAEKAEAILADMGQMKPALDVALKAFVGRAREYDAQIERLKAEIKAARALVVEARGLPQVWAGLGDRLLAKGPLVHANAHTCTAQGAPVGGPADIIRPRRFAFAGGAA